jgi:hypothetical protein
MSQNIVNGVLVTLSDTEYADLARHGKVDFRLFCQKHDLPFHFPDVEIHDPKKSVAQFPLFYKALGLFNKANRRRIYVVNGKPVIFAYSFGGLDIEYQAFDAKELLGEYLLLSEKQIVLKKSEAFWIVVSAMLAFFTGSVWFGSWMWAAVLVCAVFGCFIYVDKKKRAIKKEMFEEQDVEKELAALRRELMATRSTAPEPPQDI